MNDKEEKIKEQRTLEAVKKNLMGNAGKFGLIARFLGEPIVSQSGFDGHFPDDQIYHIYSDTVEEPIGGGFTENREYDSYESNVIEIGWLFDGLSSGMHLEIKYLEEFKELKVTYKGNIVYREIAGELFAYVPNDEWETNINKLYAIAEKRELTERLKKKKILVEESNKNKNNWFKNMKDRWGF